MIFVITILQLLLLLLSLLLLNKYSFSMVNELGTVQDNENATGTQQIKSLPP